MRLRHAGTENGDDAREDTAGRAPDKPGKLTSTDLEAYLDRFLPPRPEKLIDMERLAAKEQFPILRPICAHLCYLIARMMGVHDVFEMGSGFGYSTAWLARAVRDNGGGRVHHVVWNEAHSVAARENLAALGLGEIVSYHVGEAVDTLRNTSGPFDLILNDINKELYPGSLPVIKSKLRPGGVLIADNMLLRGKILDEQDRSPETSGIREFTAGIAEDPDWISALIPLGDGLVLALKK